MQNPSRTRFSAISSDTDVGTAVLPPRAVIALWSRFSHMYGNRWEMMYGPALDERGQLTPVASTWAQALGGYVGEELAAGLRRGLERAEGWPPTLPEFLKLCRPPVPPPIHRAIPALPKPSEPARAAGIAELLKMRALLGLAGAASELRS